MTAKQISKQLLFFVLLICITSSCSSRSFYQKSSYRSKSKKIKLNKRKGTPVKFELYRYRAEKPVSN